ncbi:hypothetical protein [Peterkaempfera sp. SMS 1(5)a]|uniref:hypothetical protein n=1 Tax=Peterkaempfera podocarpi TaxID=3232308 RepID=UPI00366B783E
MFSVETTTSGGMHEVVRIQELGHDGVGEAVGLSESVLAEVRTAVRGHLDLLGHESGTALTEVVMSEQGTRVVGCRTGPL